MKRFIELSDEGRVELLKNSKKLREKFDNYVQDCEMDCLSEKLACVEPGLRDWSYGFYNRNYYKLGDLDKFVEGVRKSIYNFGATEKLQKLADQCEKLENTNLYEHHVTKLAALYFEEEIDTIVKYTEDFSYKIYCNDFSDLADYIDDFFYNLGEYLLSDNGKFYYKPVSVTN